MQAWQNLLTQISVGVAVSIIIDILYWLIKREFLFFKRKIQVPRSLQMLPKRNNNYLLQRPRISVITRSTASNASRPSFSRPRLFKKISFFVR